MKQAEIEGGYVFVARALVGSRLWECSANTFKVAMYLLLSARYEDNGTLLRGQCRKSHGIIAEDCGISFKASRIALDKLKEIEFIEATRNDRGACQGQVLTIAKYDTYQAPENYERSDIPPTAKKKPTPVKKAVVKEDTPFDELKPKDRIIYNRDLMKFDGIIKEDLDRWKEAYPAVVVSVELAKAVEWVEGAGGRGHKKNWYMFLTNWFSRCQEKGGTKIGAGIQINGNPQRPAESAYPNYAKQELEEAMKRLKNKTTGDDNGCE